MSSSGHGTKIRIHIGRIKVKKRDQRVEVGDLVVSDVGRELSRNKKARGEPVGVFKIF